MNLFTIGEILYVNKMAHYIQIQTYDGRILKELEDKTDDVINATMDEIRIEVLKTNKWCQIRNDFLLNIEHIDTIDITHGRETDLLKINFKNHNEPYGIYINSETTEKIVFNILDILEEINGNQTYGFCN